MPIRWRLFSTRPSLRVVPVSLLPTLPDDVRAHVATFLAPAAWGSGPKGHAALLDVLLLLRAWPKTRTALLAAQYDASRPYERVDLGYEPNGFGVGVVVSVHILETTTFRVGTIPYTARRGDRVVRGTYVDGVFHNGAYVNGSGFVATYFRRGSYACVYSEVDLGM